MADQPKELQFDMDIAKVFEDQSLASIYANGFLIYRSNADVGIILRLDNKPTHRIHLSFSSAKSLAEKLMQAVQDLENVTGQSIMTTDFIQSKCKAIPEKN